MAKSDIEVLAESILEAQAAALAAGMIAAELLVRAVLREPDPPKAIRTLFEAINSRLDREVDKKGSEGRVIAGARQLILRTFSSFDAALNRRKPRKGRR